MQKIVTIKKAPTQAKPQGICPIYLDDVPATRKSPH